MQIGYKHATGVQGIVAIGVKLLRAQGLWQPIDVKSVRQQHVELFTGVTQEVRRIG
jgi:hypothetical protein